MERELLELFEAARKAADAASNDAVSSSGPEVGRCVDALKQLKIFPITYDILVSSQVGKRLRPLTKHPREKIQTLASDLLEVWKKIVIDETTRKKNGAVENKSSVKPEFSKVETVKVEKVQKVNVVKVEKMAREGTVNIAKIAKEEKKVSNVKRSPQGPVTPKLTAMVKSNDAMRDKVRELLVEALAKVASEVDEERRDEVNACDPIRVAVSVESAMFDKWGRSNGAQKTKYRSVMFNIKDQKNPDFRRKVLVGEVKPERLINMSSEEMASDQRQEENKQIKERALFDCERGGAPKATTDQFKCGRCGQRKTTYYQMQTRSADEPMTTYVTCVNCNNHWKFC
ncbi:transcription elongation factor TFIIS [Euphorbia lathyris]|uniref:transcription elongation factor TFIIS n=1 Tax=Euphorbia lathyris TaxID=212925 RepID=UPI00331399E0